MPTGEAVEFKEGDYGVIPAGSFRWDIQKPSTKHSNVKCARLTAPRKFSVDE